MAETLSFVVPGSPVPWQRASRGNGKTFVPAESKAYRAHAALMAMAALSERRASGSWELPTQAEYALSLSVVFPDRRRRDLSNVVKQLEDAWNGILYRDDSQIAELHVTREYGDRPRVEVELTMWRTP